MDGIPDTPFKPAIFSLQYTHLAVFKGVSTFYQVYVYCWIFSWGSYTSVLDLSFMGRLFSFHNVKFIAFSVFVLMFCPWDRPVWGCLNGIEMLCWRILLNITQNSRYEIEMLGVSFSSGSWRRPSLGNHMFWVLFWGVPILSLPPGLWCVLLWHVVVFLGQHSKHSHRLTGHHLVTQQPKRKGLNRN